MLFMNSFEIDEAVEKYREHPVLGPAAQLLASVRDVADQNSDGWAYWPVPCRATRALQELLQQGPTKSLTELRQQFRVAVIPIKAFYTRRRSELPNGKISFPVIKET